MGAKVTITGRNEERLKDVSNKLGENCFFIVHDVNEIDKNEEILNEAAKKMGGINSLINNAGVSLHEGSIENVDEKNMTYNLILI